MIFNLDHIGITVPSLSEARKQIDAIHPCFHTQFAMAAGEALREVSIYQPERLDISLHRKPNNIGIELIEYPRIAATTGSIFPFYFSPEGLSSQVATLKAAVRHQIERGPEAGRFTEIGSQLAAVRDFNALILTVEDCEADEQFWKEFRFRRIFADEELVILSLTSLIPPIESRYMLLVVVDRASPCHTDAEGINEIAFLCASCSGLLDAFGQDSFRSSVSAFPVGGKEINLAYLRSPSGALAEVFSVGINHHAR